MFNSHYSKKPKFLLLIFLTLASGYLYSGTFQPTELEFMSWSSDCKNIHLAARAPGARLYGMKLSIQDKNRWYRYGDKNGGLWHFCEGLILIRRAELEFNKKAKQNIDKDAITEVMFGYRLLPKNTIWSAKMGVALAKIYRGQRLPEKAKKTIGGRYQV